MRRHSQILSVVRRPWPKGLPRALVGVPPLVCCMALASCKSAEEAPAPPVPTVGARLGPTGNSTMTGSASFWQYDGGIGVTVRIANIAPGRWRVVLHANGNCTSPNGFSAGPPLEVPGAASPIVVYVSTADNFPGSAEVRLPGLALEGPSGVMGKSVVVHAGAVGSLEAQPGVPNNRVACGVIENIKPLL